MTDATQEYRSIWSWLRDTAFSQRWITVDGVSTRVVEAGDSSKPAVMLLHGTGAHWEAYAPNLKVLSAHYRVIAFDMVGNGFSDKPHYDYDTTVYVRHMLAVMDALGVEKASIIGMSLGAWVAARFAVEQPERTEKLILMSPAGLIASASKMERIRRQRMAAVDTPDWDSIKAMFVHLIAEEENRIPDLIALRQAIYRLPETKESIDHLLILQDPDVRNANLLSIEQWQSITVPALVIVAGKDVAEYESTARRILEYMPRSTSLEMPHVAHWPNFEDPDFWNEKAIEFLGLGETDA